MVTDLSDELRRAWAETDRVRAVLRSVEWSAFEQTDYDGVGVPCCPSCGGFKPDHELAAHYVAEDSGKTQYHQGYVLGHKDGCALVAALAPA